MVSCPCTAPSSLARPPPAPADRDVDAHQVIVQGMQSAGLTVEPLGEGRWMTMLAGEWKRTLPVFIRLDERALHVTALLCGKPDEGHEDVYRLLLQRNQRPAPVHFALDDAGDVVLVGQVPRTALDADAFDRVLGSLLDQADTVFNAVLRAGFASYIDAEQRWRAAHGMPPNPVTLAPPRDPST